MWMEKRLGGVDSESDILRAADLLSAVVWLKHKQEGEEEYCRNTQRCQKNLSRLPFPFEGSLEIVLSA